MRRSPLFPHSIPDERSAADLVRVEVRAVHRLQSRASRRTQRVRLGHCADLARRLLRSRPRDPGSPLSGDHPGRARASRRVRKTRGPDADVPDRSELRRRRQPRSWRRVRRHPTRLDDGGDRRDARSTVEGGDRSRRGHGLDTRSRPRLPGVEPGLYLTFFTEGEPMDGELPPVGPLEHVVVRDRSLIADLKDGGWSDIFGAGPRWTEAKHELGRATGTEPGGTKRPDLRIGGPEGVYLRFVSFGDAAEHDPIPELGPYAVVVVGRNGVEADGDPLATRTGTNQNLWELTGVGGSAFVGVIRPDIAFRTRSTTYHPEVKPFRAGAKPAATRPTTASRPAAAPAVARAVEAPRTSR